ncbi:hypothetical protein FOL47_003565 [Perkinsus chesapeaki]|uniref:Carboxypeptidase n=1 Tax=Perkinsus chesapeaki TaxID=330153 RepID=A0A7J6M7F8_PERCH|nr:hypothetical protein FOL47_003565 [Perkinsus chesapeaki]
MVHGICDDRVKHDSGYLHGGSDALLFYWFFESRTDPATSPTLIYFQGGPGASSMYSLTAGNGGPCVLDRVPIIGMVFVQYLCQCFVHRPTRFDRLQQRNNSEGFSRGGENHALKSFFYKYPNYNRQVFFIGESYAGHYIPPLAQLTIASTPSIKLKGVILGNALVNPKLQYRSMPMMAFKSGTAPSVITEKEYRRMLDAVHTVLSEMQLCLDNRESEELCQKASDDIFKYLRDPIRDKDIDPYDLRLKCTEPAPGCEYTKNFDTYFNSRKVQDYLKVNKKWTLFDVQVFNSFLGDLPVDYSPDLSTVLDTGLRISVDIRGRTFDLNARFLSNSASARNVPFTMPSPDTIRLPLDNSALNKAFDDLKAPIQKEDLQTLHFANDEITATTPVGSISLTKDQC